MTVTKWLSLLALVVLAACATGRVIYYPNGCEDRLGSPYKRGECIACVTRPVPHQYLPDNADGDRCSFSDYERNSNGDRKSGFGYCLSGCSRQCRDWVQVVMSAG